MPSLRDVVVGLVVASLLENVVVNRLTPELLLSDRFSRSILRFFLINLTLYLTYLFPTILSQSLKISSWSKGMTSRMDA